MKTVGNQLQEARLARNWTPELAARETKIRVDRLRDLEADDYTHFSSPAYARGFVRTYARALGLDEYKILRQLDNKLPEDDNASFVSDTGLPYIPEAPKATRGGPSSSGTGLYVVAMLGCGVFAVIVFVLFQAYRTGELQSSFAHAPTTDTLPAVTNAATAAANPGEPARALPVDPNAPVPPPVDAPPKAVPADNAPVAATNAAPAADLATAPKALPVDATDAPQAPVAAPADGTTNTAPVTAGTDHLDTTNAPRAFAVDPNELTNAAPVAPPQPPPMPSSARASGSAHVSRPVPPAQPAATQVTLPDGKRLILTATRDSFVRVTALDAPDLERSLYAAVLKAGQTAGFDGRKFSVNVEVPSAVNISLDGVNYGPHSDQDKPETFTVESHQP